MQTEDSAAQSAANAPQTPRDAEARALLDILSAAPSTVRWRTTLVLVHIVTRALRRGGRVTLTTAQIARDTGLTLDQAKHAMLAVRELPGIRCEVRERQPMVWFVGDEARP